MRKKILIVEDEEDIRNNLGALLEMEGYSVLLAPHGQKAIEILKMEAILPNLILLDLAMPVMDGFEFRKHQMSDARISPIPVLIMTADGRVEQKAIAAQATGGLQKPSNIDEILETVAKLAN